MTHHQVTIFSERRDLFECICFRDFRLDIRLPELAVTDHTMSIMGRGGDPSGQLRSLLATFFLLFALSECVAAAPLADADILTYHNDIGRTGWNRHEHSLTPATVNAATFQRLITVPLDDQVDAQPLVITVQYAGGTQRSVVYVATEHNTVYAIDAVTGQILHQVTLGSPVPEPLGCSNNGPLVGINSTPTIDPATRTIYVMAYVQQQSGPTYELFALDLDSLERRPGFPVEVSATQTLDDRSTAKFAARYQRQRAALLDANGRIYAAFASFCDYGAAHSRGWILSWDKLRPSQAATAFLNNRLDQLPTGATLKCPWPPKNAEAPCYLSSIWMSGFGPAADTQGSVYFTTGNSAPNSYQAPLNLSESAVKVSASLELQQVFTPPSVGTLDKGDSDFGSGGLTVLPDQPGSYPHLAVAAGKDGHLYLFNRDNLGGTAPSNPPSSVSIGHCTCGQSYFESDQGAWVVSSGGANKPALWRIPTPQTTAAAAPTLEQVAIASVPLEYGQDVSFFTSISSDDRKPGSAIIWAVGRASGHDHHVTLYAYDATPVNGDLPQLWSGVAGTWANTSGNSNIVPTVANGRVFVASDMQLEIFGTSAPVPALKAKGAATAPPPAPVLSRPVVTRSGAQYWGTIKAIDRLRMQMQLRDGALLDVDLTAAVKAGAAKIPPVGAFVRVTGSRTAAATPLHATTVNEAKADKAGWGQDQDH